MSSIEDFIKKSDAFIIQQKKEWIEIFSGFETKNKYQILDEQKNELGFIIEQGSGILHTLKRIFLRSHRPFEIIVMDNSGEKLLQFNRRFFWFFSDLNIQLENKKYGSIHRRFSLFSKVYSVLDSSEREIFRVKSPFWRIWSFPIFNNMNQNVGIITKKWQGFVKEVFTDSDGYLIKLNNSLTPEQKVLLFSCGISIDFDYFENNQGSASLLDFLNG